MTRTEKTTRVVKKLGAEADQLCMDGYYTKAQIARMFFDVFRDLNNPT